MELLWLAIVFYSAGLAAVLYLRPTVMFNENGTWKEFGYQRDSRHTLFPFWLFVITWAIVSYVLSMAVSSYLSASAVTATATATAAASHSFASDMFDHEDDSESEEEEVPEPPKKRKSRSAAVQPSVQPPVQPPMQPPVKPQVQPQVRSQDDESFGIPVSRAPSSREKPRPGYYVLDPEATTKPQGLRKYVYYGPSPPTE
jgi:hypothetical protein